MKLRTSYRLIGSACLLLALLAAHVAADEPGEAVLKQAIGQLSSDVFLERERASQMLLSAGASAVPLLEEAAGQGELESTTRALSLLESMSLEGEAAVRDAAMQAIGRLAASQTPRVAQRSQALLAAIQQVRKAEAIERLQRLGAKLQDRPVLIGAGFLPAEFSLEIGADWRGTDDDLKLLALIDDLRVVALSGSQINDAWLEHVAAAPSVQSLSIKRGKVSAAGVERLKGLKELYVLEMMYLPVDDAAAGPLAEMPQLSLLRIFGTEVSKEAGEKLKAALPNAKVDLRRGGFFGIGVTNHPLGCTVTNVQPRSAADRAGIDIGDVILSFAGKNPTNFEELTEVIAQYQPGDEVEVDLYRRDGRQKLKIALGEWD